MNELITAVGNWVATDNAELLRDLDDALPEKLTGNESISGLYALLERCRAALSFPVASEPVAWGLRNNDGHRDIIGTSLVKEEAEREAKVMSRMSLTVVPLYTHPVASAQVPREPTPKMSAAGLAVDEAEHDPAGVWIAMYDASLAERNANG